jgi:hypothetical protein
MAAAKREAILGGDRRDRREKGKEASCKVVPVVDEEAEAGPYVMVVDDSSVNRAVVSELLRSCKYRGPSVLLTRFSFFFVFSCSRVILLNCAVTAVDSGKKALKILGTVCVLSILVA